MSLRATADFAHEPPLEPALTIAFALTKGERPELAVQKLTELGADEIVLVRSARSVVRWDSDREDHALDRLRRVAREAGAQSRRARLPVIDGPVAVAELLGRPGLVLADHDGSGRRRAARRHPTAGGSWRWAPKAASTRRSGRPSPGSRASPSAPFVLRAETAAIAAAAALAWRRSAPR